MGICKNLRAGAAFMREYQQDAMKTVPQWARVVRVGRRVFGMVGVDVEIHYGRTPAHMESVSVLVPRGMQLQVGQDVFVVGPDTSASAAADQSGAARVTGSDGGPAPACGGTA